MNVPPLLGFKFTDANGFLTPEAQLFMTLLNQSMLGALSDNGWTFPIKTTAQITALAAGTVLPNGTVWFDSDLANWW